jgi:hypothetical protein
LPKLGWDVIKEIYQTVFQRGDVVPGMVATVQSFGQLAHFHPHVHAIVTDGMFSKDDTFIPLPEMAVEPFLKPWEKRVFDLLLKRGKIAPQIVKQMRSWYSNNARGMRAKKTADPKEDDLRNFRRREEVCLDDQYVNQSIPQALSLAEEPRQAGEAQRFSARTLSRDCPLAGRGRRHVSAYRHQSGVPPGERAADLPLASTGRFRDRRQTVWQKNGHKSVTNPRQKPSKTRALICIFWS